MAEIIQGMTNNGLRLLGLSQEKTVIEFTKFKVGKGFLKDQKLSELNDLVDVIDEIAIESTDVFEEDGQVSMVFNGKVHQIKEDFYFRELGLYAIDPETQKEVLYAYLNKGEDAALIPMISSQASIQEAVSMIVTIGNATNVVVNYKDNFGLINSGHNMFDIVMKDHILDDDEKRGLANFGENVYKKKTDDHLGYPEFYKKCLKEYNNATDKTIRTSRNYIIEGNIQIKEDEFKENVEWNGFTPNSYIYRDLGANFKVGDEIKLSIRTSKMEPAKKGTTNKEYLFSLNYNSDGEKGLILGIDSYTRKLVLYMSSNGTKWDMANAVSGKTVLQPLTEYCISLRWVDNTIKLYVDSTEEKSISSVVNSQTLTSLPYSKINYGVSTTSIYSAFTGQIIISKDGNYISSDYGKNDYYNTTNIKIDAKGHKFYDVSIKNEIDNMYADTGMAWLYGIDTTNEYVVIPRNDKYFMNGTSSSVGQMIKAGLPNITGYFGGAESGSLTDDAFYAGAVNTTGSTSGGSAVDDDKTYFDASRVSAVYGNSDSVQTDAIKLIPYMVVGRISSFGVVGGAVILDNFISEEKLKVELDKLATKGDLDTKQNVGDYALKSDLAELPNKANKSDVYTKEEIDTKTACVYKYRGQIADYNLLPSENNVVGDVYELSINNNMYLWTGEKWQIIKDSFNSNDYVTVDDLELQLNYKADVATTLEGYGIGDAYTKEEIDSRLANVYCAKGSVENYASLPSSINVDEDEEYIELNIGDVYNVLDTGANYVWTENGWDKLSETINLSLYALKSELPDVPTKISDLENDSGYLTTVPSGYITETELDARGYLTSIPTEYITETELNNKNYQTSEQVQTAINTALGDIETLLDEINGGV